MPVTFPQQRTMCESKFITTKETMICEHWLAEEIYHSPAMRGGKKCVLLADAGGSEMQRGECEGMAPEIKLSKRIIRWGDTVIQTRAAAAWKESGPSIGASFENANTEYPRTTTAPTDALLASAGCEAVALNVWFAP